MFDSTLLLLSQHCLVALSFVFVLYLLNNRFKSGLQKYPGPFLASLTDWWRFFDVLGRRPDVTQIRLHRKHGDIVRLGPNVLSFADPRALKIIYGLNKGFVKVPFDIHDSSDVISCTLISKQSEFYPVQQAISKGSRLPSLFSTTDEQYHAQLRKSVNSAFSMGALIQYERFVDETTEIFLNQTEALFASTQTVCNFAEWLQWYAFDVIGAITYSKPHGFVDRATDVDGMCGYLARMFSYVAPVIIANQKFRIP